ncbi:glycerate kinase [Macrococcus animalis]|uniref:glycerate kinase n=1 Tax=Macrococcus animalis TaxID=3395467 RepID=UPI0039BE76F7
MKILIAPDSYKECLSAVHVAECMRDGLAMSLSNTEFVIRPMADGGEGTVDALIYGLKGERKEIQTVDMYRRPLMTNYGEIDKTTAVIEVANIIGMEVMHERNPHLATSYGVGDVICQLAKHGYKKILVGLGGSLTNDGGAGVLEALGLSFIDNCGNSLEVNGGNLSDISSVEGNLIDCLSNIEIVLVCDVENPLIGEMGATYTYGKQKGIEVNEMSVFDESIGRFARLVSEYIGLDASETPGAGAAGGIGYGLLSVGSKIEPGAEYIADIVLDDLDMDTFDYVFTGEGKSDFQTKYGKLPVCVAKRANASGAKSILVSGGLGKKYNDLYEYFLSMHSITDGPMDLEYAIKNAETLITNTCRNIGRLLV